MNRFQPPPTDPTYSGTFTMPYNAPFTLYEATWRDGTDYFNCRFHIAGTPTIANVYVTWQLGRPPDRDQFPTKEITFPPAIWYEGFALNTRWKSWNGTILITG